MNLILVTGASGFVGSNLVIRLLEEGYNVLAFHRKTSNPITLKDVDIEHVVGDILDQDSLRHAIRGCDTVFHTAGLVSFRRRDKSKLMETNVIGTRNVVESCLECGVGKLVHTSTIATLGYRTDGQHIDESMPYNWGSNNGYRYTKYLAEQEVLAGVERGLDATIVNPSIIIGPRDVAMHGGGLLWNMKRGCVPAYIDGGINLVSVHDVINGHIAAALKGKPGERYILGGMNVTHKEMFELAADTVGGRAPKIKAPMWLALTLARISETFANLTNSKPWLAYDMIVGANHRNWFSIEKARRELGYEPTSIQSALLEAYEWYKSNGMISG